MAGEEIADRTVWLTPEERHTWLALVATLMRLPPTLEAQLQRDAGLTLFEYVVLARLSERPDGTTRMSHLAAMANGSLSRLSHVVRRLENRGLVRRTPDPADGRYTLALLTDAGRDLVTQAAPGHAHTVLELVFRSLSPGMSESLGEACREILQAVDGHVLKDLAELE